MEQDGMEEGYRIVVTLEWDNEHFKHIRETSRDSSRSHWSNVVQHAKGSGMPRESVQARGQW